ncbi:MAG: hypothetical protein R3C05_22220 [Pirellulaceae bacterium]
MTLQHARVTDAGVEQLLADSSASTIFISSSQVHADQLGPISQRYKPQGSVRLISPWFTEEDTRRFPRLERVRERISPGYYRLRFRNLSNASPWLCGTDLDRLAGQRMLESIHLESQVAVACDLRPLLKVPECMN